MSRALAPPPEVPGERQRQLPGRGRRWLFRLMAALVIGWMMVAYRAPLLTGLAEAWIVNDPLVNADAILVLGGGVQNRPFGAADLYRRGYAGKVLLIGTRDMPTDELGLTKTHRELMRLVLVKQGVPEGAIEFVGKDLSSTLEEAEALRQWTKKNGTKRLLVVTDVFHTRRTRWLFRKALSGSGVEVRVIGMDLVEYGSADWWQVEGGLIDFQNEVVKYVYARIRY